MSGVAIATALMPPLCTVGYGIANLNWVYAAGALYLFFINFAFIATAAYLTSRVLDFPEVESKKGMTKQRVITSVLLLCILAASFVSGYVIVKQNEFAKQARHFVLDHQSTGKTYIYDFSTDTRTKPYTVTLRLAGEALSDESRNALCQAAERYGIMSSQLVFMDDATIRFEHLDDKQIMQNWMESNEQQLQRREDSIRVLAARLAEYEKHQLPSAQLAAELRAQYPDIKQVTFAQGEVVNENDSPAGRTVVMIKTDNPMSEEETKRLNDYLRIRLQTNTLQLIML
jgi:hypothetical protein